MEKERASERESPESYLDHRVAQLLVQLEGAATPLESFPVLDELSFYLVRTDPPKAEQCARRALQGAKKIDSTHWVMRSLLRLSGALSAQGRYKRAQQHLQEAWTLINELPDDPAEKAYICRNIAAFYARSGDAQAAIRYLNLALNHARRSGDQREVVATLGACGDYYFEMGLYADSIAMMNEAAGIYEAVADSDPFALNGLAHVQFMLGHIYRAVENPESALRAYITGLELVQEMGDRFGEILAYLGLCSVATDRGDFDSAVEWYQSGLAIAEKLSCPEEIAQFQLAAGSIHAAKQEYAVALACLRDAEQRFAAIGHGGRRVEAQIEMAEVLIAQQEVKDGVDLLVTALTFLEPLNLRPLMVRAHMLLAQAYEHLGRFDKALRHYQHSLELGRALLSNEVQRQLIAFEINERAGHLDNENVFRQKTVASPINVNAIDTVERGTYRSREMTAIGRLLAELSSLLQNLRHQLLQLHPQEEANHELMREIARGIEAGDTSSQAWEHFERELPVVDPQFLSNLTERYPDLTAAELRICLLLHMGRSNKEIAELLNISGRTVDTHRAHIRKKLGLRSTQNLVTSFVHL